MRNFLDPLISSVDWLNFKSSPAFKSVRGSRLDEYDVRWSISRAPYPVNYSPPFLSQSLHFKNDASSPAYRWLTPSAGQRRLDNSISTSPFQTWNRMDCPHNPLHVALYRARIRAQAAGTNSFMLQARRVWSNSDDSSYSFCRLNLSLYPQLTSTKLLESRTDLFPTPSRLAGGLAKQRIR